MNNIYLPIGIIFMIMAVLSYIEGINVLAIIFLIIFLGFMFMAYRGSSRHVNKRVSSITYDGIIQTGLSKIDRGTFYIDKDKFMSVMEKINDLVSSQGTMPEFGLDAIYLMLGNQEKAELLVSKIKERGVEASAMQERTTWKIKIEFN